MTLLFREAQLKDAPAIRALAVDSVPYSMPANRAIDVRAAQANIAAGLKNLEFQLKLCPELKIFVAEATPGGELAGYIMLVIEKESSTGELQVKIQDLGVKKSYWGKKVVHGLYRAAENFAASLGSKYLTGIISTSNKRGLLSALKLFGFKVERVQVVKDIQPLT